MSQPNNNQNPNNKITKTVVGLRLSNHWKPPRTTGTQNCRIEQKYSKIQKTKVISLYEETPKLEPNTKKSPLGLKKAKNDPKLSQNQKSELKEL